MPAFRARNSFKLGQIMTTILKAKVLKFNVQHADNRLFIYLNSVRVATMNGDGDPQLNQSYELKVPPGAHDILVLMVNHGGPTNFEYSVVADGVSVEHFKKGPTGAEIGLLWANHYVALNEGE